MSPLPQLIIAGTAAVTLISTTAWLASGLCRRNAAVRHWLLLSALLCCLATPVLVVAMSTAGISLIQFPLLPAASSPETAVTLHQYPVDQPGLEESTELPPTGRDEWEDATGDDLGAETAPRSESTSLRAKSPAAGHTTPVSVFSESSGVLFRIVSIWGCGALILSVGLFRGWLHVRRILRSCRPADRNLLGVAEEVRRQMNLTRFPPIVTSDGVTTPIAAGLLRPSIVLPDRLSDQVYPSQLKDVLVHEAAHIIRRDHWLVLFQWAARIAFWPIVTIHLLNRSLTNAREEICDNYVLAGRNAVEYGETLFQIASLSRTSGIVPLAAGILPRRGRLEHRLARLLDPRRNLMTRPRRTPAFLFSMLAVCTTAAASGSRFVPQPSPAPADRSSSPPATRDAETIRKLIAGLKQTETTIRNLSVTTHYVKRQLEFLPVKEPVRLTLVTKAIVTSDGKVWNDTVGQQVNIAPKGKTIRPYNGQWRGAYDGTVYRRLTAYENNGFQSASLSDYPYWHGVDPREFTTHYSRKPVTQVLTQRGGTLVKRDKWDRRPVVVVDTTPVKNKASYKIRFWIDPERKIVVRRAMLIRFKPGQRFQEYTRIESRDHAQVAPGIWLPGRIKYESVSVTAELKPEKLSWSYEGKNTDWKVNQKLPADTFKLKFPENIRVNDHRAKKPKGKPVRGSQKSARAGKGALSRFLARISAGPQPPVGKKIRRYEQDANGRITLLRLRGVKLSASDLALIAGMRQLVSLDASDTGISDRDLAHFAQLKQLRTLSLRNNRLSGDGLAKLRTLAQLKRLDLASTAINDPAVGNIAALRNLEFLSLRRNRRLTDAALVHLGGLKKLRTLRLGETSVSDAGVKRLKAMPGLRNLTLDRTRITEEGLEELATDRRFHWMAVPRKTALEFAQRIDTGKYASARELVTTGPPPPKRGEFHSPSLTSHPRTDRDRQLGRHRFRLDMRWIVEQERIDGQFYVEFAVDRGAVRVHSVGLRP